jgi:predicted dehydrogenase
MDGRYVTRTIGIIGLGSIGMRHKENLWKHLGETEVVGYDPDPEKHSGTGWMMGDLGKMIEMCTHIIIASPTSMHLEHLIAADGKPTFVEKPIARTMPVIYSSVLMVGYNLRFHSCVKKTKEWMERIGTPLRASFTLGQHSDKPPYLRDGVVLNWSHELDLCLYLLGPGRVTGSSTRLSNGRDDISDILITHDNGCRSVVHLDYVTKREERWFSINGTDGEIFVDLPARKALLSDGKTGINYKDDVGSWNSDYIEEMQAFLDRCDGKETIGCTADEAIRVLEVCLEVRKQAGL